MRIDVNRDLCADHGQCVLAAAEVFRWAADGTLEFEATPSEDVRDGVELAIDSCPVQAIRVVA